jgi:hypothetical protein
MRQGVTGQSGAPDLGTGGDRTVRGARPGDGVTGQSGAPDL